LVGSLDVGGTESTSISVAIARKIGCEDSCGECNQTRGRQLFAVHQSLGSRKDKTEVYPCTHAQGADSLGARLAG
jgi:hypothetical protein